MDEIVSVLIFVVIVAISILGRIKSERKASRDRQDEAQGPPVARKIFRNPCVACCLVKGKAMSLLPGPKNRSKGCNRPNRQEKSGLHRFPHDRW